MVKYHLYCDRKVKWGLETCGSEGENVCLFVFKDMVSSTWEEKVGELRPSWVIWTTWVIWDHVFKQKKKVVPFHSGLCHMRAGPKGHGLGIPHNRDSQVHAWFHVWLLQPLLRCLTPWCCWEEKKKILELCAYAEISSFTNKTFLLDVGLLGTPYGCHKALFIDVD